MGTISEVRPHQTNSISKRKLIETIIRIILILIYNIIMERLKQSTDVRLLSPLLGFCPFPQDHQMFCESLHVCCRDVCFSLVPCSGFWKCNSIISSKPILCDWFLLVFWNSTCYEVFCFSLIMYFCLHEFVTNVNDIHKSISTDVLM